MSDSLHYDLPPDLIAQQPRDQRDQSRLMVLNRAQRSIEHLRFHDIVGLLQPDDCLVINNTKVVPARLYGRRTQTGGKWEGLVVTDLGDGRFELLCQTRGQLQPGETIELEDEATRIHLERQQPGGRWTASLATGTELDEVLNRVGHVPLPPYIRKGRDASSDQEDYQTVYASRPGAIAAPTAGLHFTPEILNRLKRNGVRIVELTLHVGVGTFQPIRGSIENHRMYQEWCELKEEAVSGITACRDASGRVVAVGTTSVRVLETAARSGRLQPWEGDTNLFIRPPFRFRAVDCMLTNFHLPNSTLLALVHAFAGEDFCREAYESAVQNRYRFYSYGDAMLII